RLLEKDYPGVNVKTLSKDSKATDYGKAAILALPASAGASNLGLISTSTSNTMGSWAISGEAVGAFARVGGFLLAALW
ncbi:S-type Pyocin domain-containing protein, partial [Vibrio parahaemolyticus]|nr:S-type Pyocin domain-containing protein [Vibrio parahaemolyticus]